MGGYHMQKKTGIMAFILFLLLPMTGRATPSIPGTERVETAQGPVFYYTIQKGDTLWDLSRRFYNSQWVWPGLWEMNHEIENPHIIYPGNRIRIFLADVVKPQLIPPSGLPSPPEKRATVVTKATPSASPKELRLSIENSDFIKETPTPPLGYILMAENSNVLLAAGDILFINPVKKNNFIPGNQYDIFSTKKVSLEYDHTRFKGVKHTIKATVTLLENSDVCTRAVITQAFGTSEAGDPLMAHRPLKREVTINPTPRPIQARIICSQHNEALMAQDNIVFMDAGSQQHVKPGDIYTLYKPLPPPSKGFFKKTSPPPLLKNGTLMVLHTEAISSTVKILYSTSEVLPGDIVR